MRIHTFTLPELEKAGVPEAQVFDFRPNAAEGTAKSADVHVLPVLLPSVKPADMIRLAEHYKIQPDRLVVFDPHSRDGQDFREVGCWFVRAFFQPHHVGDRLIAWPHPSEDFGEGMTPAPHPYRVSVRGPKDPGNAGLMRTAWDMNAKGLRADVRLDEIREGQLLFGEPGGPAQYHPDARRLKGPAVTRERLLESFQRSACVATGQHETVASAPTRLFEAASAGKPTFVFADGLVLPFADIIDYGPWLQVLPADMAPLAGHFLLTGEAPRKKTRTTVRRTIKLDPVDPAACEAARRAWVQYFNPARWPDVLPAVLARRLGLKAPTLAPIA